MKTGGLLRPNLLLLSCLCIMMVFSACSDYTKEHVIKNDYGNLPELQTYIYDEKGYITSFSIPGLFTWDIEYDDQYDIKKINQTWNLDTEYGYTYAIEYTVCKWNEQGMPLYMERYEEGSLAGYDECEYHNGGNYMNGFFRWYKTYNSDGRILDYRLYDELGNEIAYEHYSDVGDVDEYTKYNACGSVIESESIDSDGYRKHQIYSYYEDEQTTKSSTLYLYNQDGSLSCYIVTEYNLDGSSLQCNYHADGTMYAKIFTDADGSKQDIFDE